jgi:hypothetical protein
MLAPKIFSGFEILDSNFRKKGCDRDAQKDSTPNKSSDHECEYDCTTMERNMLPHLARERGRMDALQMRTAWRIWTTTRRLGEEACIKLVEGFGDEYQMQDEYGCRDN